MSRTKIDFGIDLGTTNSAIAVVRRGVLIIKSLRYQKDTTPSCVSISKSKKISVGDDAVSHLNQARLFRQANPDADDVRDTYCEFKRMMGTKHEYDSVHLGRGLTPEELSSEVLKHLKSYVLDEDVVAAVITVPAMFEQSQFDATHRAAELAGLEHCVLLQEPIAASAAFGLEFENMDGRWIVFDFGGGTFDAALMEVEEGIPKVLDTAGDNLLGGRNLDEAIVDKILIPRFEEGLVADTGEDYSFDRILNDKERREALREALKIFSEQIKISLAAEKGPDPIELEWEELLTDDEGEKVSGELKVSLAEFEEAVCPVFQKAIDLTRGLLERNKLKDSDIERILLIGGPTLSRTCRRMLAEEFDTLIDTSIDPMTAVAVGAAVVASTCDLPGDLRKFDPLKAQLKLHYDTHSVETEEPVAIKVDREKTEAKLPKKLVVEIANQDGSWSSGKMPLGDKGELVDVILNKKKTNVFDVNLFDGKGKRVECEPAEFSIAQGQKIAKSTLALGLGVGIVSSEQEKTREVFAFLEGLDMNARLPAVGRRTLRTQKELRPGNPEDRLSIPIYNGNYDAQGCPLGALTRAAEGIIENEFLPGLIPAGSEVEVVINVGESRKLTGTVLFVELDETVEVSFPDVIKTIPELQSLGEDIDKAKAMLNMDESIPNEQSEEIIEKLYSIEADLDRRGDDDPDSLEQADKAIRQVWGEIDRVQSEALWPNIEQNLQSGMEMLDDLIERFVKSDTPRGAELTAAVEKLKEDAGKAIQTKDVRSGIVLLHSIGQIRWEILKQEPGFWVHKIQDIGERVNEFKWKNETEAKIAIKKALEGIQSNPSAENLEKLYWAIVKWMDDFDPDDLDDQINPDLLRD